MMKRFFVLFCVCCMFLVTVIGCRRPPREANAVGGDNYNDGVSHDSYPNTQPIQPTEEYHIYGAWRANYDGVTHSRECACGEIETNTHNFASASVTREPTHISEGEKTYVCVDCGATKTESIPANGADHTYGPWQANNDGMTCSRSCACGKKETSTHNFVSPIVTKEPTHTSDGIISSVCAGCGELKNERIPANVANHSYGAWQANADGTTCSRSCACGNKETKAHDFSSGSITKEPTHTSEGVKTYVCGACGAIKTENIPADANKHNYGGWEQYDCTYHVRYCSCGEMETDSHTFDYESVIQEPTYTAVGLTMRYCSKCGATKKETIPKLEGDSPSYGEARGYDYQLLCVYCKHDDGIKTLMLHNGVEISFEWNCSACGEENVCWITYNW